jgi:hypothetical protein
MSRPTLRGALGPALSFTLGLLLASPARGQEPCAAATAGSELAQHLTELDVAFGELDEVRFRQAQAATSRSVRCLGERLSTGQITALYRAEALTAFLDREPARAVAALRSLVEISPGYVLSDEIAPPGHPLRTYYDIAVGSPRVPGRPLARPRSGWIEVDGTAQGQAPVDRPYLFQRMDRAGKVVQSQLVAAGQSPDAYEAVDARARAEARAPGSREQQLEVRLLATAGVAALASGGLYLAAQQRSGEFWSPATPTSELPALRTQTNTLGWLSAGTGAVAISTGAAALLVGRW